MGFLCSSVGKESACSAGDLGSIPRLGRSPGEGNGNPLQYPCLEKSHGHRSLVGCSPWGRKESGITERLTLTYLLIHTHTHTHTHICIYIYKGGDVEKNTSEKKFTSGF